MSRVTMVAGLLALCLTACFADDAEWARDNADEDDASFLASLPGWGRYIVLEKLDRIVPVYLAETQAVLDQIDSLPAGTVEETTPLDQIPIPDLFAHGNEPLREVLSDADFEGGRSEHDVAWLRGSANGLQTLQEAVSKILVDGTSPPEFDEHLTNTGFFVSPVSGTTTIDVGVAAVSRFFCNLDVHIIDDPDDGFSVDALESCD